MRGLNNRPADKMMVYSFRVEAFDDQGNRLSPVTVEMKGMGFEGSINEGDQVEINKRPRHGKAVNVKRLRNLTAGSTFKARGYPFFIQILNYPAMLIWWLLSAGFIIGFFWLVWMVVSELMRG